MTTLAGSGSSTVSSSSAAATEAVRAAARALEGKRPTFGFLFVGPRHSLQAALAAAKEAAGGAELIGCTTAGEITEKGLLHGGVAALVVHSDTVSTEIAVASGVKADHKTAAAKLCEKFPSMQAAAKAQGVIDSTTVVLVDGLAGTGDKLIDALVKGTRPYQQIVGGAAGDEGKFEATQVGSVAAAGTDRAAVLHAFGPKAWGVGVDHGLKPSTPKMVVTRSKGNVVYELDGVPAFEVYKKYAKERGVDLRPATAGPFLINNELGVYFLNHLQRARAPLSVGTDGSLACAADIPEGSAVSILDGKREDLLAAVKNAAREAKEGLLGAKAAGVLLFDCICRGAILDKDFQKEIDAVAATFPGVPITGFLTYGEIARYRGKLHGWHNTTAVVVAIPA
jgi:methyl-accepting chemotaxis protein